VFGKLLKRRAVELEFDNRVGARSGQAVIVGVPEALFLGLVTRFYLFPLLAGLAGAGLGHYLGWRLGIGAGWSDALALLAGLLAGAWVLRRGRAGQADFSRGFTVHLLRVADQPDSIDDREVVS